MDELVTYLKEKSVEYWNETGDFEIEKMPSSIVDFVIEFATNSCHFPPEYTEEMQSKVLMRYKSTLAMACVDVLGRTGNEGEKAHSEHDITRTYDSAWISDRLLSVLPNYVTIL